MAENDVFLPRTENQARGLGQYAIDFLAGRLGRPDADVLERVERFHLDSIACGVSALACGTNCADRAAARGIGIRRFRSRSRRDVPGFNGSGSARKGRAGQQFGRPRMGLQRHELRL